MLNNRKKLWMIACMAVAFLGVQAQNMNPSNNGNTPYSRYGYGRLSESSSVSNRGMGGISYGVRSNLQINPKNPASYTAVDSLTFLFDFAINGQIARFKENGLSQTDQNGGLDYLAMQFPLSRYISCSAGLLPYSYVGYSYGGTDSTLVSGTTGDYTKYVKQYVGNGGLNKVYLGFGVGPFSGLSAGINVGYIFGEISNNFAVSFSDNNASSTSSYQSINANAIELQFGLQYTYKINQKNQLTIGAVYTPKMNMWVNTDNIKITTSADTLSADHTLSIPQTFGIGATYVFDQRITVGTDFKLEQWGDVAGLDDDMNVKDGLYKNTLHWAVGGEYLPSLQSRNYFQRMRYRMGMHYRDSYIDVKNSRNKELGFTLGLGLPLKNQKSLVNMAFEYVHVKPDNKALLSESYFQFNLGLTFNEFWFFKNKLK